MPDRQYGTSELAPHESGPRPYVSEARAPDRPGFPGSKVGLGLEAVGSSPQWGW